MRRRSGLASFARALIVCGLAVAGCSSDGEFNAATTMIPPYEPLIGVRDGDTHEVFIGLFCGADYLDYAVNDATWRAEELVGDDQGWIPPEWSAVAETIDGTSDMLMVKILMESNESRLIATANGRSVAYRPIASGDPCERVLVGGIRHDGPLRSSAQCWRHAARKVRKADCPT